MAAALVLELRGIDKGFGATQALDDVSFALHPGEIHALLGENGAGKSTLIKIMTGVYQPDRGEILLSGAPIAMASAAEAQRHGIAAIYQEPLLFPDLNVAENIFIGHQDRGAFTNWRRMFRQAEDILRTLGIVLDVRSPARGLTLAAQQSVEIAKAISLNVRVLIMDEPTASLSAHEAAMLFRLVRDLRDKGVAILFVSHRLEEVFEIADRVTVFRDGRRISTRPRAEVTPQGAIADMVGREMGLMTPRPLEPHGDLVISVRGLAGEGAFQDVSFDVHRGEVLGFAGLIGAGRTDVGLALFGIEPATAGTIVLGGRPVAIRRPIRRWHSALPISRKTGASLASRCPWPLPPTSRCRCCDVISTGSASSARARSERPPSFIAAAWRYVPLRSTLPSASSPAAISRRSC